MTDYERLPMALRCCAGAHTKPTKCPDYGDSWCGEECLDKHLIIAADAIEALNRLLDQNTQRCEALRKQLREAHESYERHLNELEAQLPKLGHETINPYESTWAIENGYI